MKRPVLLSMFALFASAIACAAPRPAVESTATVNVVNDPVLVRTASPVPPPTVTLAPTIPPLPAGMPNVETDSEKMLALLKSGKVGFFEAFAAETYSEADFAKPGTVAFTVVMPADQKIFFSYGWCAADMQTLNQNLEHIQLKMYFNEQEIPGGYILPVSSTEPSGWECASGGMVLSGWQAGHYKFRVVASFDAQINDGEADYEAGDYIHDYDVTVQ